MPSKTIFSLFSNHLLALLVNSILVVPLCIYKRVSGITHTCLKSGCLRAKLCNIEEMFILHRTTERLHKFRCMSCLSMTIWNYQY